MKSHLGSCPTPRSCEEAGCDPCCGCGVSTSIDGPAPSPLVEAVNRLAAAVEKAAPGWRAAEPGGSCAAQHPTEGARSICVLPTGHAMPHRKADGLMWGFPRVEAPEKCSSTSIQGGEEVSCTLDIGHESAHIDLRSPGAGRWW